MYFTYHVAAWQWSYLQALAFSLQTYCLRVFELLDFLK